MGDWRSNRTEICDVHNRQLGECSQDQSLQGQRDNCLVRGRLPTFFVTRDGLTFSAEDIIFFDTGASLYRRGNAHTKSMIVEACCMNFPRLKRENVEEILSRLAARQEEERGAQARGANGLLRNPIMDVIRASLVLADIFDVPREQVVVFGEQADHLHTSIVFAQNRAGQEAFSAVKGAEVKGFSIHGEKKPQNWLQRVRRGWKKWWDKPIYGDRTKNSRGEV